MTPKQYDLLAAKLARIAFELEHDTTRMRKHSYSQRAVVEAIRNLKHARDMIVIYHGSIDR